MITKDSWNDQRKQCPTNRKLLAVFDAGDNRRIFKSTIFTLEDVIYIKDRSGTIYFCADDPEALDIQVTLLDVANREWCEQNSRLVTPMLETPDTSYPSGLEQREGETKEEWEKRIFGE